MKQSVLFFSILVRLFTDKSSSRVVDSHISNFFNFFLLDTVLLLWEKLLR